MSLTYQMSKNPCIGLTGGIGCGKSTVARLFETHGANIIDTDAISHQLTQVDGSAMPLINAAFGANYLTDTGALDRAKMRDLIFSDSDAKRRLENILHPLILARSEALLTESCAPYSLLMAPILLECPAFLRLVHRILVVDCNEQNQISRVMQRSGLTESQIRSIIAQQSSSKERLALADDIIQNDGVCDDLGNQVTALHRQYMTLTI